jgi:hypothetical protein
MLSTALAHKTRASRAGAPFQRPTIRMLNVVPLWTLHLAGHSIDAELVGRGEQGWELRLLRDGRIYGSQRFVLYAEAVAFGEEIRHQLSTATA